MSDDILVQAVDAPSASVNAGLTSLASDGRGFHLPVPANFTDSITGDTDSSDDNMASGGTGPGPTGLNGTTISNHSLEVQASNRTARGISSSSPYTNAGKPATLPTQTGATTAAVPSNESV
jgi:hypothetical protein